MNADTERVETRGGPSRSHYSGVVLVLAAFTIAIASGIAFLYAYWTNAGTWLLGITMGVGAGGLGAGLVIWAHRLMRHDEASSPRELLQSTDEERQALVEDFLTGEQRVERRRLLGWISAGVLLTLVAGIASAVRSLGKPPMPVLKAPAWKRGDRVVTPDGKPVSAAALAIGSAITVYPEGRVGSLSGQTMLIRVKEDLLHLPKGRTGWAPMGNLAYSRICTHAGCPVALYEVRRHLLLCPCHQSTFAVLQGAVPTSGPAARALPQLPLYLDPDGNLRAGGDFTEHPGPGFWSILS